MELQEIYERMHSGKLYLCDSQELVDEQLKHLDMLFAYNQLPPSRQKEKSELLQKMFAHIGKNCYIETPFHANWGGKFCSFGDQVYANFNLTMVDDAPITVGNSVMFGPDVVLCTATHPISPDMREKVAQYNLPITIGNNVWIGAGCIVMPGVTIGDNSVIGAGSIVTKDIPANVVAYGAPCRVMRPITQEDKTYYRKGMEIRPEEL
ncbi:MAG: sugar O-acetyltransferase [Firmicutes bacterium]|nr:sugar O-acetyltransferase [Bacillota bacterium]